MDNLLGYDSVEFNSNEDKVVIIDQRLLPGREVFISLSSPEEIFEAIALLKVRGAPAIGVAAAYGLYVSLLPIEGNLSQFKVEFEKVYSLLLSSRPTAVNLKYALDEMKNCFEGCDNYSVPEIKRALLHCAKRIKEDDIERCRAISENGLALIKPNCNILTHCNAGHLAVSRYGTAIGPIYLAQQRGLAPKVYVDETRPLLQGARLTAYELTKSGVDATLICDNMVSSLMSKGEIDMVMVGCDRVAANGDVANKIGTSGVAILANYYKIPFYVLGPSSSIDCSTYSGDDIIIEQRPSYEVTDLYFKESIAPSGIDVYNPSFDVTKNELITGIITEKRIYYPPYNFLKSKSYD